VTGAEGAERAERAERANEAGAAAQPDERVEWSVRGAGGRMD